MPTLSLSTSSAGKTPAVLGYNMAHYMAGSNAADWWRYSGVTAARAFISPSDIEPVDDITGIGDGVVDLNSFSSRRNALRANAANGGTALSNQYVNWAAFEERYRNAVGDTNRFTVQHAFSSLRQQGISILANITASPSRFALADTGDWANAWELWQHYYAQAFLLGRDYGVERFSMFNEPNNWSWPTSVSDPVANWLRRLQLASDAIQAALADVNSRYGTTLRPQILGPNTANGASKYKDTITGDIWGQQAVLNNRRRFDGSSDPSWSNIHSYNYQKYSTSATDYSNDFQTLRSYLNADGASSMPIGLTEFNVRTGANYDSRSETLDSPSDYAALAANSIALSQAGADYLYLFKFGQTVRSGGTYPVAKNGTHYVQNDVSGVNNVGGATKAAEVYRLFVKASGSARNRLAVSSTAGSDVWAQVTRQGSSGTVWAYIANTGTSAVALDLDFSALGLPEGSLAVVEEVSERFSGGVSRIAALQGGRLASASLAAQSVWLVSLTPARSQSRISASADTLLRDGSGSTLSGGSATDLLVRADGNREGRRVSLLKFNVQQLPGDLERVLLNLNAATQSQNTSIQAHVYGLSNDGWSEATSTWASLPEVLKQNVGDGNRIAQNVVADPGGSARILGQLVVSGSTAQRYQLDVTDFVRSQTDGWASFLVVQDHRWDVALPSLGSGDTQADGLRISAREAGAAVAPELLLLNRSQPAGGFVFSLGSSQTLAGTAMADEDLIGFDGSGFSQVLDGSSLGLAALQLDASARLSATDWLLSFSEPTTLAGLSIDDSDIVRLSRQADGSSGITLWFDASDVGFSTNDEDIDALALLPNSSSSGGYDLLLSTLGSFSASGLSGEDEDIIRFRPSSLGASSSGSLSMFFDGSSFGLGTSSSEDVDALAIADGRLYLSTVGGFSVNRANGTSLSGGREDVFVFTPTAYGGSGGLQITAGTYGDALFFDGSSYGLANNDIRSLELPL